MDTILVIRIVICLIAGYLVGNFSTAYVIGKINHIDIRNYGSGNAGTTNAFRTLGKKAGIITFIGDFFKPVILILLLRFVFFNDVEYVKLLEVVAGYGCVMGHNFPVWLHFHGGKGIAVTGGVFASVDPLILPVGIPLFAIIVLATKYVSLGSLAISLLFPIWLAFRFTGEPYYWLIIIVAALYTVSAFVQHRENIRRLLNGTENKIGQHVKIDDDGNEMQKVH